MGSLLSRPYPTEAEWRKLLEQFSPEAIAHKLLLAHIPFVFREEPLKYSLFRRTIADAFDVEPSSVFIVGSAMAGRSLKGKALSKSYSSESDIDTLIVSESLFTSCVMGSMAWLKDLTRPDFSQTPPVSPELDAHKTKHIGWLSDSAEKGIWRPDSLPNDATTRIDFFEKFASVSLKTLGLQLSEDTVAKVNGRVARSFDDAANDLSHSIFRLRKELRGEPAEPEVEIEAG